MYEHFELIVTLFKLYITKLPYLCSQKYHTNNNNTKCTDYGQARKIVLRLRGRATSTGTGCLIDDVTVMLYEWSCCSRHHVLSSSSNREIEMSFVVLKLKHISILLEPESNEIAD